MFGIFTLKEAVEAGFSFAEVRRKLRNGHWIRLRRSVYADHRTVEAARSDPVASHALDCQAAIQAMKARTVASDRSAAVLHGMTLLTPPDKVTLTTERPPRSGSRVMARAHVFTASLPAPHCTTMHGVDSTSAARTIVDLGRHLSFDEALVTADAALHEGKVETSALFEVLEDCREWPLVAGAFRVVEFADPLCESPLESLSRICFANQGLPRPETQVEIAGARVDFLFREHRTIVEADGMNKYTDPEVLRREKLREDRLRELGYEVVRITWAEVMYHPERVAAKIRGAFARAMSRTAS